jgi:hypothetical protein
MKIVLGKNLKVGDTIKVWWKSGRDTITKLEPYVGNLPECKKAQMESFALFRTGMTIFPEQAYQVYNHD